MNLSLRNSLFFVILLLAPASSLFGQRYHISYAPNSQEGLMLQLIEQLDGAPKLQQMEEFLKRWPNHPSVPWIYSFMQERFAKENNLDKSLESGAKLLELFPDDLEAAVLNQKTALQKGDQAQIEKWTLVATKAAEKLVGSPKPFYVTQQDWDKRLAYAGSLISQEEYGIFKKGIEAEKPSDQVKALDELISKYPNSVYAVQALPYLLRAHRALGNTQRALEIGEKLLAKDMNNEEAILTVAQTWLDRRSNYPRVLTLSNRLLMLGQSTSKPDSYSIDDWNKRKAFFSGAAYQMIGTANVFQNNFAEADRAFRAAMPFIKGNVQAEGSALFYLGWSNYYMEKYKEAAVFFRQCMSLQSPFKDQALKQLDGMRRERRIVE